MSNQNYSFYLFCNLRQVVMPSEEAYDIQFEIDKDMYNDWLRSAESTLNISEYDAMLLFLTRIEFYAEVSRKAL